MTFKKMFGVEERPDQDFWAFTRAAFLTSLAVTMIYFVASIISDIFKVYLEKRQKEVPIPWARVLQNAFSRSVYSFTSSVLLYALLQQ